MPLCLNYREGLTEAHLNVCSLRNKVQEVECLVYQHNIHILTIVESHLDSSFGNEEVSVQDYSDTNCTKKMDIFPDCLQRKTKKQANKQTIGKKQARK